MFKNITDKDFQYIKQLKDILRGQDEIQIYQYHHDYGFAQKYIRFKRTSVMDGYFYIELTLKGVWVLYLWNEWSEKKPSKTALNEMMRTW